MQISVSTTGSLGRRVEVAVPASEVSSAVEQRLKQLSRTVRLKGFRPGKAPLPVVRKQFGEQVHAEVVSELMRSSVARALVEQKLTPAADPRIEPINMGPGADLKFAAVFEVMPEIKVAAPEAITLERPQSEVLETDIDAMIESMRRQKPVFTAVERAVRETDRVTLDYVGTIEGEPFEGNQGTDTSILVGSRQSMPELEEGVKGAMPGERRKVSVAFPPEHPNKSLAGKTAQLDLTIKKVEEQSLPELDAEFCRAYGVETGDLQELRAEVRKSMERELAELIRGRLRSQVLDALYSSNPVEVPRTLLDAQAQQLQVDAARRMGVRDASQLPARQAFEEPARRRVALGLLMGHIVQSEGIKVDRERVRARLDELVSSYPNPDEALRAYQQSPDALRQVESAVLEDQVIEWVIGRAKVNERQVTFKELTGFGPESNPNPA